MKWVEQQVFEVLETKS